MNTIELPMKVTTDDLFTAITKLPTAEFTAFVRRLVAVQSQRGIPLFTADEEQALLQTIEQKSLSPAQQQRLNALRQKSRTHPLTAQEQAELLQFVKTLESQNVIRVKALVDLAAKRGIPLNELMQELGLEASYA